MAKQHEDDEHTAQSFSLIRYRDLFAYGVLSAAFASGCSSSQQHSSGASVRPGFIARMEATVSRWFTPKPKPSGLPVPKHPTTSQPVPTLPHSVATAPIHVLAQTQTTASPKLSGIASSSPAAAPSPTPVAAPIPTVSPNVHPRIVDISITSTDLHGGDLVSGTVTTSSNVASVEARVKTYSANLHRVGVGRFALTMRVPALPFFLRGTYQLQVIARNTAGVSAEQDFPISVH